MKPENKGNGGREQNTISLMSEELDQVFEEAQKKLNIEIETLSDLDNLDTNKNDKFYKYIESSNYEKIKKAQITFDTETPPLTPILEIISEGERVNFGTLGSFSVIQGKPKAGKSFVLLPIIGSVLFPGSLFLETFGSEKKENNKVLFFDTEQGRTRTKRILERLEKLARVTTNKSEDFIKKTIEEDFELYSLREFNSKERFQMIEEIIRYNNAKLIVIDGIIDLTEANDKEEAKRITEFLMKVTEVYQCHILTIIHENKEGINSRGDVGSLLDMKAEAVYRLEKQGNRHELIPHRSRDKEPSRINFSIVYNEMEEEHLPELIQIEKNIQSRGRPPKKQVSELDENLKEELLKTVFINSHKQSKFDYRNLMYYLKQAYIQKGFDTLGDNQVKELIANLKGEGYLSQLKQREPYFLSDRLLIKFNEESSPNLPF
jgi:hypothetical protein